jgi:uncharacterized protein
MTSPLLWTLITLQIAMGAFDTLYHHELTERLSWRRSQSRELLLHGIRNGLYAVVFVALGWSELHGLWAAALIAVLAAEIIITLLDFVEEDLSRRLPASERINHTLLALNYGAILALAGPVLLAWMQRPTAIDPSYHGIASFMATAAAVAVAVFGLRDVVASRRLRRLNPSPAQTLVTALPPRQRVLVTGATGFIGRRLVEALVAAGHEVTALIRNPATCALRPPLRLVMSLEQLGDDTVFDAVINLAGEPIATRPWTIATRRQILRSRLNMTQGVVRLLARLREHPKLLISASAIGWYGLWQDENLTEFDGGKSCFTHRVCEDWERAARRTERLGIRVVRLRIGLVLGTEGGMLGQLLLPFELGVGGPIGSGRQWMSWIERDDLVRLIAHIIATPSLTGPVNATAPNPVRNTDFAAELGRALHRPSVMPLPGTILRFALRDFADELLLGGQRVLPEKALLSGFEFKHATLRTALAAIFGERAAVGDPASLEIPQSAPASRDGATGAEAA